jgi:hypothetical protein
MSPVAHQYQLNIFGTARITIAMFLYLLNIFVFFIEIYFASRYEVM